MALGMRLSNMVTGNIKPYCQETVLLHSAFVLVEREALVPLRTIDRECSKDVVGIISHTVAEILSGSPSNHRLQLSEWLFNEMCRSNSQSFDEESDKFSEFPPLPGFSCAFYLELMKELQWAHLMAESLYSASTNVSEEVLTALISTVALPDKTDEADTSLFSLLATTLLQAHAQSCNPKHATFGKYHPVAVSLPEGISLVKMKLSNIIQIDILRGMIDLSVCSVIHEALKWQVPWVLENMIQARYSLQGESSVYQDETAVVHIDEAQEGFTEHSVELSAYNSECVCPENEAQDESQELSTCSEEVHVILDFLFNVITHDWIDTSHWSIKQLTTSSGTSYSHPLTPGQISCLSWHPLHKGFVALCGVLCFSIHRCSNSKHQQQIKELYNALVLYIQTCGSQSEKDWLHSMEGQKEAPSGTTCILEEFQSPSGPIEVLLFKPDKPEELFKYSVQQVCDRTTACEECFDWMLTAEEFYSQVEWLECFTVHGPQLSNQEQVIKMIDILCFQWHVLTSGGSTDDEVFIAVRNVILEVYSKMEWTQQEGILLYSQSKVLSHTWDMCTDSIFFDPLKAEEDRESFRQNLVETFNKLVISTENEDFDADMQARIVKAALVMPYILLLRAVEEAIKHAAHCNCIYKVHRKLSCLCGCRTFNSGPSLLSTVIKSAAVSVSSKQHQNNLVNLLVLLFQPTDARSTGILALNDALEVVILPFLFQHDNNNSISTAFVVRLLAVALTTVDMSRQSDIQLVKEHFLPIMLCLCELLESCSQLWLDLVPDSPLVDVEELKVLVLVTLGTAVGQFCELLQRDAHLSKCVVWLYKRLETFNWTVPLYLIPLFDQSNTVTTLLVPPCLLATCILPSENWTAHPGLCYGPDAVFTALFEACRVSDVMCQKFVFHPEKLGPVKEGNLVNSLAQVLPHCVWQEYMRVVSVCQQLIDRKVVQEIVCGEGYEGDNQCVTSQLSCLLLKVMEFLNSNGRRVNPHVWLHMTKHYVVALKGMFDEKTDSSVLVTLFAHACRAMSVVSSDVTDQLFVLALDLLTRISIQGEMGSLEVSERLKECTSSVSDGLHKASLLQKLVQGPLVE